MTRQRSFLAAVALVLLLACAAPLNADMIIHVGNLNLTPGGTGSVDVTISSSTGADLLDLAGVEFRIATTGSSRLEFVNPPSDLQLSSASYVFPTGDSTAISSGFAGSISTALANNDTYIGGDGTWSGAGVTVPTSAKLLATLNLTANTLVAPAVGDIFTISLVDSANTFFRDPSWLTADPMSLADIHYSSNVGTINIVPEPAMGVMMFGLAAVLGLLGRKRLQGGQRS